MQLNNNTYYTKQVNYLVKGMIRFGKNIVQVILFYYSVSSVSARISGGGNKNKNNK